MAPFVLDPNDHDRLIAGGRSLWGSNDVNAAAPTWTAIKPAVGAPSPAKISAIAVAEGNPDVVWVGHEDGRVYRTANGTTAAPAWKRVDRNPRACRAATARGSRSTAGATTGCS